MSRRPTGRSGFTLPEVLASLVLVGFVLPVAVGGVTLAMRTGALAAEQMTAGELAAGKLAELLATGQWQEGDQQGDFEPDSPGYRWSLKVNQWEQAGVSELVLSVQWTSQRRSRQVRFTTLARRPTQ